MYAEFLRPFQIAERVIHEHTLLRALKKVPAGYDKDHPQAEYLKYKSWYLEYPVKDQDLSDIGTFLPKMVEIFEAMKPFNDYLNRALADFRMPTR